MEKEPPHTRFRKNEINTKMVVEYLNDTSSPSILPFKLQEYLWQQTGAALKSKLVYGQSQHSGYESTCVILERLILGHKTKELKVQVPEVYKAVESIPRWTFVKGSLPYVIHCCAAILEQRRHLGLSDKLSVAVTKLFATLHWIVIESCGECCENGSMLELNVIELFIQTLVPVMHNLYESDLTFSLQSGFFLWNPIWANAPPVATILAIPVLDPDAASKAVLKYKRFIELTPHQSPTHSPDSRHVVTYFDIAVMKVLLLDNWTVNGYRWGLQYLQTYLQTVLLRNGFESDNCYVMEILHKFTPRRSLTSTDSGTDRHSPSLTRVPSGTYSGDKTEFKIKLNETIPSNLLDYVTASGELKLAFILKILQKLVQNSGLWSLSGNLLFVITQLTELALDSHKIVNELKRHFECLVYCFVHVAKMLGCENHCQNQMKCVKGDHFRLLLHAYFFRLINSDIKRSKIWFEEYVNAHPLYDVLEFLHSFLGFCIPTPPSVSSTTHESSSYQTGKDGLNFNVSEGSYEYEPQGILHQQNYVEQKMSNEQLVLKWLSVSIFKTATLEWDKIVTTTNLNYFTSLSQLSKYLQIRHNLIYRKVIMSGILNSFGKYQKTTEDAKHANTISDIRTTPPASPDLLNGNGAVKLGKMKGKKNWFKKVDFKTTVDENNEMSIGSFPGTFGSNSYLDNPLKEEKEKPGSLPRSFFKGKFKSTYAVSDLEKVVPNSISLPKMKLQAHSNTETLPRRGRLINTEGLYAGLRQLRCLFDLGDPGMVPEETVVAAMLDLEAPVLARAAYLLELAHFVRLCNKEHWPAIMRFSQQGYIRKGLPHRNLLMSLKHKAGLLFHKWGVAITKKLDDIMLQDKLQHEERGGKFGDKEHVDFMYQGDISVVSSRCPHALRYIACQLLLEITAFLRETFVVAVQIKITSASSVDSPSDRTHAALSHTSSGGRKPRHSLATSIAKRISAVQRRKSSVGYLLNTQNDSGSMDTSSSPTQVKVKRNASAIAHMKKSPKVLRKFSRQISRQTFDRQTSLFVEDQDELPEEMLDFPWINVLIQMNKSINFLCAHGGEKCPGTCPVEQLKSCNMLMDGLKMIYKSHSIPQLKKAGNQLTDDPIYYYLDTQVRGLIHVPFAVLCKAAFVMENPQLVETMAASWEVLLYPCHALRSAAASLFLVSGVRLEASVSNFLSRELTCTDAHERAKAVQRFGVLWDCQFQVYQHLEESAKITLAVPLLRLDYTVPSRPLGHEGENVPDAPWIADLSSHQDLDLSDDEEEYYYLDSRQQKEAQAKKRAKKLKKLREGYVLNAVPFSYQSSVEFDVHDDDDTVIINTECEAARPFFPQSMSHGILHLIRLLDDTSLTTVTGQTVSVLAHHIIWKCLVDHPETFFRRFFEKITHRDTSKQEELVALLRKLLVHVRVLPPHAAHLLFNNLVGIVTSFDRENRFGKSERIASILPLLWQIAPSVNNIYFGEMKQSLRREHIDHMLMVSSNLPSFKEVSVSYTQKEKFAVFEDMTFKELLDQAKRIFEVETAGNFFLVDKYNGTLMENNHKIRDVYPYKRGVPGPALKLEELGDEHVLLKRQQQVLTNKMIQISQLVLSNTIFDHLPNKRHAIFLYSELREKPSFAHKAFEFEFDLCLCPELGVEIFCLDVISKNCWVKFISGLLIRLSEFSHYGDDDLGLFLEPINGALLLHCEDVIILRGSLAALLNVIQCYGKRFSIDGYEEFLPILLNVYAHHEENVLIKEAVEFTFHQFYALHQNQFILQMFASVAQILLTDDMVDVPAEEQFDMVPARCLFSLLESLDHEIADTLDIMSLVEKPIKPYVESLNDDDKCGMVDLSIRLALTIIAYKPESSRSLQMMFVLSGIIPYYMKHLASLTEANPLDVELKRNEHRHLKSLMKYVATIIEKNEYLSQKYNEEHNGTDDHSQDNTSSGDTHFMWRIFQSAFTSVRKWFSKDSDAVPDGDDIERTSICEDGVNPFLVSATDYKKQDSLRLFYQPRTALLFLASDFILKCTERYKVLCKENRGKAINTVLDIIEDENSLILLDVAISLLRLTLLDHDVLLNAGLQRFLLEAMPCINWQPNLTFFHVIVKKINYIFTRILQKPEHMRYADWNNLEILVKGLYITIKKQEYLAKVPELKDLLHTCTKLMIADLPMPLFETTTQIGIRSPTTILFNMTVIKFAARLLFLQPVDYNLQENFSCYVQLVDAIAVERFLIHWLLPICIRMGTGRFDYPRMTSVDIHFVASLLISILTPENFPERHIIGPMAVLATVGMQFGRQHAIPPSLTNICFLGFKILLAAHSDYFGRHWKFMKKTFIQCMTTNDDDVNLWSFISFLVSHRLPLLIHLQPIIRKKIANMRPDTPDDVQRLCHRIKHDFMSPPVINCRATMLQNLLNELTSLSHVKAVPADNGDTLIPNEPSRSAENDEDDESYINRVLREKDSLENNEKMGDSKQSILRRSYSSPKKTMKDTRKLKKQVSFQDTVPYKVKAPTETSSPALLVQPDTKRAVSPIRLQLAKLSKRSKLRILKQPKTEEEDDKITTTNEPVNALEKTNAPFGEDVRQSDAVSGTETSFQQVKNQPDQNDFDYHAHTDDDTTDDCLQLIPSAGDNRRRRFESLDMDISMKAAFNQTPNQFELFDVNPENEADFLSTKDFHNRESNAFTPIAPKQSPQKSSRLSRSGVIKRKAADQDTVLVHSISVFHRGPETKIHVPDCNKLTEDTHVIEISGHATDQRQTSRVSNLNEKETKDLKSEVAECSTESTV